MELQISPTGIPFIEFDDDNRIAFRMVSKNDNGYSRLFIKACVMTKIMDKDKKISFTKSIPNFYITNLNMSPLPNPIKTSNKYFKAKNIKIFKDILKKYSVNGKIPVNKIEALRIDLRGFNVV